ncbi:MAG: aminodeoxychorismate/anthranilate synthase component II [Pseudomonadota bacterium]
MIILIDNYDSFTYNLVQYLGDLGEQTHVIRNDKDTAENIADMKPKGIIISPGPSDPDHAGICLDMIKVAAERSIPLFGVCLGLQSIGQAFGGNVIRGPQPMHGKVSSVTHDGKSVFQGIPSPFNATRYHSLVVEEDTLPNVLEVTARTDDKVIMGLAHKTQPIHSVQFHPESIATEHGHDMLKNFLNLL